MIVVIIGYSVYSKKHHVSSADAALQRKRKQKYWNNMYQIMSDSRIFKGHIEKLTNRVKRANDPLRMDKRMVPNELARAPREHRQ